MTSKSEHPISPQNCYLYKYTHIHIHSQHHVLGKNKTRPKPKKKEIENLKGNGVTNKASTLTVEGLVGLLVPRHDEGVGGVGLGRASRDGRVGRGVRADVGRARLLLDVDEVERVSALVT